MAKDKDVFPKVTFDGNVDKLVIDAKGTQAVFKELALTGTQIELLSHWVNDNSSHVRVTIEQVQGELDLEGD